MALETVTPSCPTLRLPASYVLLMDRTVVLVHRVSRGLTLPLMLIAGF